MTDHRILYASSPPNSDSREKKQSQRADSVETNELSSYVAELLDINNKLQATNRECRDSLEDAKELVTELRLQSANEKQKDSYAKPPVHSQFAYERQRRAQEDGVDVVGTPDVVAPDS